ncbi:MAG: metallophosphoesterase family protein [Clostridia bacterium]|nr:metallophosphoesterase family protein [Clostridia bacterium]
MIQFNISSFASFDAPKLSESEWNELYSSLRNSNTLPTLNVGAYETQASLCWHADKATAKAEVKLSKNADMSDAKLFSGIITPAETDSQVICRVYVTGLEENTKYYYQWNSDNGWSDTKEYETKSFGDHKALVVGDIQISETFGDDCQMQEDNGRTWNNILSEALGKNPDISYLVSPGDNTSTGSTAAEWQTLLMPEALRSLPMALAIGNHDKKGMTYNFYTNMPNEYYGKHFTGLDRDFWFRYGDVLYLFFDSTSGSAPDHMAFAKEAVKLNKDAKWRIGVVHHGIYGAGDAIGDLETEILLSTIFTPIFESFDLDLVITGHTHSQGRSHFMENRKVVQTAESGKTYTDPKGIVYLNSNAVCGTDYMDFEAEHLAYAFMENDVATYSTLEFKGNKLILETRRGDNSELLDSITIERTKEYNEASFANSVKRMLYKPVELLGFIYVKIDNLIKMFS